MPSPDGNFEPKGSEFKRSIPSHHAMTCHPEPKDLEYKLKTPFEPRANLAVSVETPEGTTQGNWAKEHEGMSTLEQHCLFFDRDRDGVIWPVDTFTGFHELGYNIFWCILAVFIIHSGFSYFTGESWIPDPLFRITLKNIHRAKHGSDTGTYDTEGRFIPHKFEEIFSKYDKDGKGGLTFTEGLKMIRGNRMIADPIGWTAAFFEWLAAYLLIWPKDGVVTKESMRKIYDGSIFFDVAEREKKRAHAPWSGFYKTNKLG